MKILMRCLTWLTAIVLVSLLWVPSADAHPLGNFTINHYAGLKVAPDGVSVDYVLDMAEIPAFQEINQLDTDRNRKPDPTETATYPDQKCREAKAHLNLSVNHQPLALALTHSTVEFPAGVGGLATLRLTCDFEGSLPSAENSASATQLLEFEDSLYPQRLGWREITVTANDVPLHGSFTAASITKRLTEYPDELLSSPLDQRRVSFEINSSAALAQRTVDPAARSPIDLGKTLSGRSNDAFTQLITQEEHSLPAILLALAIAFLWGGLHALSPGHGKTVVGAYLVGSRSKFHHALFLGLTVTLTHTAGIFALGLLTLGTSEFLITEELYPWLSVLSGLLMTAIGLNLLVGRLRSSQVFQDWKLKPSSDHSHDHDHHTHHSHSDHHHNHSSVHSANHLHSHSHDHAHDHAHSHAHKNHEHSHGGKIHSHLPPGTDGTPITWSSILALGISGGLLPCPSALVVLLSAIALGRIGFGLALVSAFSLGLAAVLTGIGLTLVYARDWFERLPIQSPKSNLFPAASALLVTLIGLGITTQALFSNVL